LSGHQTRELQNARDKFLVIIHLKKQMFDALFVRTGCASSLLIKNKNKIHSLSIKKTPPKVIETNKKTKQTK